MIGRWLLIPLLLLLVTAGPASAEPASIDALVEQQIEDATFSGVELPTRFTLGPNAELWGDIFFLGARFDTIDVRDGAMPWSWQTRNAWLRGLKHKLGAN
ncbi:MAG: hypothetical protein AAGI54_04640 [Planctomycetota bacterium]